MEPAILFPEILFPEIMISRANPNTRSRRRRLRKKAKIRSLKAGCNGDAPPPSQVDPVADEVILQQVEDDTAVKMMPFSSELLSDAPPPPNVTIPSPNSDREIILQSSKVLPEKKRIRMASTELKRSSYYLRSGRNC